MAALIDIAAINTLCDFQWASVFLSFLVAFSQIDKGQVIILKKEPARTGNTSWLA